MKVFISWSGERSRKVGELLNEWLQCVLQAVDPWMSSRNIERGTTWFTEIFDQLSDTSVGIVCLTRENKNKPWILFESGALAKGLTSSRVCTFLIDLEPRDLEPPLSQFNHTFYNEESIRSLVSTLNARLGDRQLKDNVLETVFSTYYPQFEAKFKAVLSETPEVTPVVERAANDILNEILMNTRSFEKRLNILESTNSTRVSDLFDSGLEVTFPKQNRRMQALINRFIDKSIQQGISTDEIIKTLIDEYKVSKDYAVGAIEWRKNYLQTSETKI